MEFVGSLASWRAEVRPATPALAVSATYCKIEMGPFIPKNYNVSRHYDGVLIEV